MSSLPATTRALVVATHGPSEVLRVEERSVAAPGPGELTVEAVASGVNFIEIYQREGVYPVPTPFVLGGEGAGIVRAVGADVAGFAVGDRVAWATATGSHADVVTVPAAVAVPVPEEVDLEQAAGSLLQGMTAHYLVNSTYPVQPGDSVLVHAAAGGAGQLVVQLAKAKGAYVIGTVSSAAKAAVAAAAGADQVVRYDQTGSAAELAVAIRSANGDRGVSAVYDGVGQSTFEASLAALDLRGTLVLFGAASGQVPPFDLQRLNGAGSLFVTRPTLGHYLRTRDELLWRGTDVFAGVTDGSLRIAIGGRYPLTEAATAYDDLQDRRSTGKLLLTR
jgi:NADPH2:quinone reductase